MPAFGTWLRTLRLERELSQDVLAERAGLSIEAISALERGTRRAPQRATIAALSRALELDAASAARFVASAGCRAALRLETSPARVRAPGLPTWTTPLLGREHDLAGLESLLERYRIVTIVGMGGAGKTRVASELATRVLARATHAVRFVEFADVAAGSAIDAAVARAVCDGETVGDPLDVCAAAIGAEPYLLVLDNCEHVIAGAAAFAARLVGRCPNLRCVATSRQPLEIAGESVVRLPHLSVPDADAARTMRFADARAYAGVALFADRAREAGMESAPGDAAVATIAEICRRIDGNPLAIELAAVRTRSLALDDIARRLDRVALLSLGGNRVERHRTLRALVDWSYDLLEAPERTLLAELSVFVGGFTLEAARAVASCPRAGDDAMLDSLVAKSFVVRAASRGRGTRYVLLETIRAYAQDRLEAAGDAAAARDRHLAHFAAYGIRVRASHASADREARAAVLDERANFDAAIAHAVATRDGERGIDVLVATRWYPRGAPVDRLDEIAEALDSAAGDPARRARLWSAVADANLLRFNARAEAKYGRAATHARGRDPDQLAVAYSGLVVAKLRKQDFDGAAALCRELDALPVGSSGAPSVVRARAQLATYLGERERAIALFEDAVRLHRASGNLIAVVTDMSNVAEAEFALGRVDRAVAVSEAAMAQQREIGDSFNPTHHANHAAYAIAAGDLDTAYTCIFDVLASQAGGEADTFTLQHLGLALALDGAVEAAAQLHGYATATLRARDVRGDHTERVTHERLTAILERELAEAALRESMARGAALTRATALQLGTNAHAQLR